MIFFNGEPFKCVHNKNFVVYISGGITGVENWQDIFNAAEQDLSQCLHETSIIFNPVKIGKILDYTFKVHTNKIPSYTDYMREDIKMLAKCNAICMLPNWQKSKGARLEYRIAKILNMQILEFKPE